MTVSFSVQAQLYRVYFTDKGEFQGDFYDAPVNPRYLQIIQAHTDSLWMCSKWLNYALVECNSTPVDNLQFKFIHHIEKVEPVQSIPLQVLEKKDSLDPALADSHRQWQLDTMGYPFFQRNKINGAGITIAIIDAGFAKADESRAFQHIYTSRRVLRTYDFIDNDSNVYHGSSHGTSVWSLIAGNLDGKPIGLAQKSSFILLRSEDSQTETMADEDRWILAIEKAYEWGADIVNSSIGFSNVLHKRSDLNGQTAISKAADIAAKKGMLVVISAGNEWITAWKTLAVPADAEGVISVGGIDKEGKQSYFSSVGPTADGRTKPDVVAPGTCIAVKGNELVMGSGTSYAAPLVAGYLACMLEIKGKGNFTRDSLKHYGGLYPYFDYVYGYGVPTPEPFLKNPVFVVLGAGYSFEVDKEKSTIKTVPFGNNKPALKHVFLKIEDKNGVIKFSRIINIPSSGVFKVPTGSKAVRFSYNKNYLPATTDKWVVHFDWFTQEY